VLGGSLVRLRKRTSLSRWGEGTAIAWMAKRRDRKGKGESISWKGKEEREKPFFLSHREKRERPASLEGEWKKKEGGRTISFSQL